MTRKRNKPAAKLVRCRVTLAGVGVPARGARYLVYGARSGEPIQRGRTDARGEFVLLNAKAARAVEFFDERGRTLGRKPLPRGGRAPRLRVSAADWRPGAARAAVFATTYDVFARQLERHAGARKVAAGAAAARLRSVGRELDALLGAADAALAGVPGAADRLRGLGAARSGEGLGARDLGYADADADKAPHPPAFVPGMAPLFGRVLRLGAASPDAARGLLGAMFGLNRDSIGLVRALARLGSGRGGDIPLELTDPYADPRGHGMQPDLNSPEGKQQARCEVTLIDALEGSLAAPSAGAAGGSGPVESGEIVGVAPAREPLSGDRSVRIVFRSSLQSIADAAGKVSVSFPARDGRVESAGAVESTTPLDGGRFEHVIRVPAALRTREGVVQVRGFPTECMRVGSSGVSDPALQGVLTHVDECLGVSHGTPSSFDAGGGGSVTCEPRPINWLGGLPEIHFRWTDEQGRQVFGDVLDCGEPAPVEVPDREIRPAPSASGSRGRLAGHAVAWSGEWKLLAPVKEPCRLERLSVALWVEADRSISLEYRTANDPQPHVSLALSPPLEGSGSPRHLIDGTLYNSNWDDRSVVPTADWESLGVLPPATDFAPFHLSQAALPRLARTSLQVLRASAGNGLVGFRKRGLEIVRVVRAAGIRELRFVMLDHPRNTASDRRVGPDERLRVVAVVEPPSYATTGVEYTVGFRFGGQDAGTATVFSRGTQPVELHVTLAMWERSEEGDVAVEATLSYRYTSQSAYPEGVALGVLPGAGAASSVKVLPRIVVMGFMGQWDGIFLSGGGIDGGEWLIKLMRNVAATLRESGMQNLVTKLTVTGRVAQVASAPTTGNATVDGFVSSLPGYGTVTAVTNVVVSTVVLDTLGQTGTFSQVLDPAPVESAPGGGTPTSILRGCVEMFASEWAFREGNNEWGRPQREWDDEESTAGVDFYVDESGAGEPILEILARGPRKTHFVFVGHSRGAGACFNLMSWMKRTQPAEKWDVLAAIYLDAMHTDGFFQPVRTFPVCAERLLHFYANERGTISNTNCPWDGEDHWTGCPCQSDPPNCPGSSFQQFEVDGTHGEVPDKRTVGGESVLTKVHDAIVAVIRSRT